MTAQLDKWRQFTEVQLLALISVNDVTLDAYNWYVGRRSPLGNPFPMRDERDRIRVCDEYAVWLDKQIVQGNIDVLCELYSMMDYLRIGKRLDLGCHCAPRRCHANKIKKVLIQMFLTYPPTPKFRYGKHTGYQVSTKGDVRFSALNAMMEDGRTIEQVYQCDVKGYQPGGTDWRLGKGKPPKSPFKTEEMLYCEYLALWRNWAMRNEDLMSELRERAKENDYTLADMFMTSKVNQARALAQLLTERFPDG